MQCGSVLSEQICGCYSDGRGSCLEVQVLIGSFCVSSGLS